MGLHFLNGLFLFAALAALVPVIIHLIQRRRIRQVVFGSVRFLRNRSKQVLRRRRLRELLLILLRCVALGVLALAFARPFFWQEDATVGSETLVGEEAVLVLIDTSYSMSTDGRLDRAKAEAMKVLDGLGAGSRASVATFSGALRTISPFGAPADEARRAVGDLKPSFGGTKLELALQQAARALDQRREQRHRIVLISDFQRTAWGERADLRLAFGTELRHVDVAAADRPNVAIERVVTPRLAVAGGEKDVIAAWIANASDAEVDSAEVAFHVGEKVIGRQRVSIRGGAATAVRFRYDFAEAGDTAGHITVTAADGLQADNTAYFCVHVTPRIRVLLISGRQEDGFFLATAAVPDPAGTYPFAIRRVAASALKAADFEGVDVALFVSCSQLPAGAAEAVRGFLEAGGGVGLFCGPGMDVDRFNATFSRVAPCRLWKPARSADETPVVISWVDYQHEIFEPFAGPRSGDFGTAQFAQYLLVTDSQAARVLARFSSVHPALLEKPVGRGRSVLYTSSADMRWNNLPIKAVFAPFVHQVLKRLCAQREGGVRNLTVGDWVRVPPEFGLDDLKLATPEGAAAALVVRGSGDGERSAGFAPDRPGIYEVQSAAGVARFAVNLAGGEGDLRRLDVPVWLAKVRAAPGEVLRGPAGTTVLLAAAGARERAERQQRIWMILIGLTLGVLLAEMILAARSQIASAGEAEKGATAPKGAEHGEA